MNEPLKAFITYSHENEQKRKELRTCLAVMERAGKIKLRDDSDITAGGNARQEHILKEVADSDILLYLVSADSLASENCNKELTESVRVEGRVIPIILESCDWLNDRLSNFQALPDKGKPINKWQPESDGWQNVVEGIREAVEEMRSQADSSSGTSEKELRAELAFQHGNVFMMIGQINKAIEHYSRVIELNPNNAATYNNRGAAYYIKGDYERVIVDYTKMIELKPDDAKTYYNRGKIYREKGDIDLAIADFNTVIQLKSDYTEAYIDRGIAYYDKGEYDRAIEDYTKAIHLNPNHANAYNNRGNAYIGKGEYDRAIKNFDKAIDIEPNNTMFYNNRGGAYAKKGDYDRAIADFTKVIGLNSDNAEAYNYRGMAYYKQDKVDRAIADYTKAIDINPDYANAYNNRGVSYDSKEKYDRAIADFNTAIQLKSNLAEAYSNRGNAYNGKEEYDRAIEDCNRAIQLKPDYADAYVNRGNAYNGKGEYERVIADFNTAIQLKPNLVEAYFNRGNAYNSKGEIDRAIEDFNTAIQLKPDFAEAYINRGIAYGSKDYYERAIADFNTAIQRKPNLTQAYNNRGAAYYQQGDFDRAIEDYDTAIQLKPDYGNAYYNRGETWLHLEEWDKARMDLTIAKDMGIDIIAAFHNDYKSVEAYERGNRVKLPEDIATMLTQRRRSRFPKMEKFLSADGTPLESPDVLNLLAKLRDAGTSLSQYIQASPTFGLKTGRQETFVVDSTIRDRLIAEHPSSADILKPFLRGRDIRRWQVARPDSWLIFTCRRIEINRYPAIRKHLEKYRSALSKRAGKQKWYELPATKSDAEHFAQTKLICPNRYDHQTFAVDTEGFYCGDTCYLIPTEETWLCGLLNSRAVEWFFAQASNQLTGDYLRARSGYMQQIPIPDLSPTQKAVIGKIVDYLIYLQEQPTTNSGDLAHARDAVMLKYFERIIDGLAYESYLGEELHQGQKEFFKPLLDERLPQLEEIRGDKMSSLREIFERLYERTHPVRSNLFFLDSVKSIRIIEDKA